MVLNQKVSTIFYLLGSLLLILGLLLLLPIFFIVIYNEESVLYISFIIPALLAIIFGLILTRVNKEKIKLTLTNSMLVCGLGWIVASVIGALPFRLGLNKSFIDSFFEAVSGFTTTGITVFQGLEYMPRSILFWRSFIQWVGGLGILTFFLVVTFRSEGEIWQLFDAESHKIDTSRPVPNVMKTVKILWSIYIGFTILQMLLLIIFQTSFYDALVHSLTSISTGGFSSYDSSIGHFKEIGHPFYRQIEYIFIFFMLMGGINFLVHFKVITGNFREMILDEEIRYFWGLIMGALIIIFINRAVVNGGLDLTALEADFRKTLFQIVALATSTGYGTEYIGSPFFPALARQLFMLLMLIGGCVGSTAGGFKVLRVAILHKLFKRELKKIYLPKNAVIPVTIDREIIKDEEVMKIAALFFAWLALILVGSGITALFSNLDAFEAASGMFSAVGNMGPFYFSVEEMASMSSGIKLTYIIGMLAGRLEVLPIFIIFTKQAWKWE
ncbi:TrkH family potassium uptake protein [Fuchsiella alkaliacetigena]|uniref:TrkH family potassium uptake protein n=1 Tax=Fuchsiella alkaliacetigena TaxID=957042 RepID=UPI00200B9539|nr:TrkH family potassium uptake protein [Fuchsiella alkaliacetigena]MCK8825187.1 TrkH family potassium uptake protein [Fuchsiella alkaliacetigena]